MEKSEGHYVKYNVRADHRQAMVSRMYDDEELSRDIQNLCFRCNRFLYLRLNNLRQRAGQEFLLKQCEILF
ncbi:14136_t:CDS:2 [Funneliformis mosseae]|uniref:14136_t:CDS:1 n=1 Tax=Funneliformis mosseae TaxID=27381 RepID=A0A9N9FV46_FUNMO|nr:14136_t:CDS:2 [Funneliformis mosseae]